MKTGSLHKSERVLFMGILLVALVMFEAFNFASSQEALNDLFGPMSVSIFGLSISWATALALAFCGADFAGMARILTPEKGKDEPMRVIVLFAAWIIAATLNSMLTWYEVGLAMQENLVVGNALIDTETLYKVVPSAVSVAVWFVRVLLIMTFSEAVDNWHVPALAKSRIIKEPQKGVRPQVTKGQNAIQLSGTSWPTGGPWGQKHEADRRSESH